MLVIATRQGFYKGSRRRAGVKFEMPEADKKMPRWVQPANEPLAPIKSDSDKALDAIRATAGPKRAGVAAVRDAQGFSLDQSEAMVEHARSFDQPPKDYVEGAESVAVPEPDKKDIPEVTESPEKGAGSDDLV